MKINDKKELHAKEAVELRKMLRDGNELLLSLKLDREQNKLKNTRSLFNTRKTIAVIKSILKGKEESEALPKEATVEKVQKAEKVKKVEKTEKTEKAEKKEVKKEKTVKAAPSTK